MSRRLKSSCSRRQFFCDHVGGVGATALTAYLGAWSLLGSRAARAQGSGVQRRLLWVNLSGGWDILESVDPKESSASSLDMIYDWSDAHELGGSASSGVRLGRWMPEVARRGEHVVVVRGLAMGTTSHDAGPVYADTGVLSNSGRVNAASIPSIVASESSATIPLIQLDGGLTPLTDRGLLNPVSTVRAQELELYRAMYPQDATARERDLRLFQHVIDSAQRLNTSAELAIVDAGSSGEVDRYRELRVAAEKIRTQIDADIGQKLSLGRDDLAVFGSAAAMTSRWALALKLIQNNLASVINLGIGGFDTHSNQSASLETTLTTLDRHLGVMIDELRRSGDLDTTLIVLHSDFGRTPRINRSNGRDHWPVGGAMIVGGGLAGGRAVGATDENLNALSVDATTGEVASGGTQLNPTHIGGSILELTLGSSYLAYRSYLSSIPCLTRLRGA